MVDDIDKQLDALVSENSKKSKVAKATADDNIELTAEERKQIEEEVKLEIAKELKAEKRKQFKADAKQRLKKQVLFRAGKDEEGEDTELVFVQLAPHMPHLRLDNDIYYPNRAYRLSKAKASVIKEQMYRGDLHDAEIHGKNMNEFYGQRPRNSIVGPNRPLPAEFA